MSVAQEETEIRGKEKEDSNFSETGKMADNGRTQIPGEEPTTPGPGLGDTPPKGLLERVGDKVPSPVTVRSPTTPKKGGTFLDRLGGSVLSFMGRSPPAQAKPQQSPLPAHGEKPELAEEPAEGTVTSLDSPDNEKPKEVEGPGGDQQAEESAPQLVGMAGNDGPSDGGMIKESVGDSLPSKGGDSVQVSELASGTDEEPIEFYDTAAGLPRKSEVSAASTEEEAPEAEEEDGTQRPSFFGVKLKPLDKKTQSQSLEGIDSSKVDDAFGEAAPASVDPSENVERKVAEMPREEQSEDTAQPVGLDDSGDPKATEGAHKDHTKGVLETVGGGLMALVGLGGLGAEHHLAEEGTEKGQSVQSVDDELPKAAEDAQIQQGGGVVEKVGDTVLSTIGLGGRSTGQHSDNEVPVKEQSENPLPSVDPADNEEPKATGDAQEAQSTGVVGKVGGSVLAMFGLGGLGAEQHHKEQSEESLSSVDPADNEEPKTTEDAQEVQSEGVVGRVGGSVLSIVGLGGPSTKQHPENELPDEQSQEPLSVDPAGNVEPKATEEEVHSTGVVEKVGSSVLAVVGLGGLGAELYHKERSEKPLSSVDPADNEEPKTTGDAQEVQSEGVVGRVGGSVLSVVGLGGPSTKQHPENELPDKEQSQEPPSIDPVGNEEPKATEDTQEVQSTGVVERVGGSVLAMVGLGGLGAEQHLEKEVPPEEQPGQTLGGVGGPSTEQQPDKEQYEEPVSAVDPADNEPKAAEHAQQVHSEGVVEKVGGSVLAMVGLGGLGAEQHLKNEDPGPTDGSPKDQADGILGKVGDTVGSTIGLGGPSTEQQLQTEVPGQQQSEELPVSVDTKDAATDDAKKEPLEDILERVRLNVSSIIDRGRPSMEQQQLEVKVPNQGQSEETSQVVNPNNNQEQKAVTRDDQRNPAAVIAEEVGGSVLALVGLGGLATEHHLRKEVPEQQSKETLQSGNLDGNEKPMATADSKRQQLEEILERVRLSVSSMGGRGGLSTDQQTENMVPEKEPKAIEDGQGDQGEGVLERVGGSVLSSVGLAGPSTGQQLDKEVREQQSDVTVHSLDPADNEEPKATRDGQNDQTKGIVEKVGGSVLAMVGLGALGAEQHSNEVPEEKQSEETLQSAHPADDEQATPDATSNGQNDQTHGVVEKVGGSVLALVGLGGLSTEQHLENKGSETDQSEETLLSATPVGDEQAKPEAASSGQNDRTQGIVEKIGGSVLGTVGLGEPSTEQHTQGEVPAKSEEALPSVHPNDQSQGIVEKIGGSVLGTVGLGERSTDQHTKGEVPAKSEETLQSVHPTDEGQATAAEDGSKSQVGAVVEKVGGSVLALVGLGGLATAEHLQKNVPENERPAEAVQSMDEENDEEAKTSKDGQKDRAAGVLDRAGDTAMSTIGVSGPSTDQDEESQTFKDAQNDQAGGVLERVGDTVMSTVGVSGPSTNEDEEFKPSEDAQKDKIGVVEKVGGSVLGLVGLGGLAAAEHSEKNVPESERPTEAVQSIDQGNDKEAKTSKDAQTDQAGGVLERVGDTVMSTVGVSGPSTNEDEEFKPSEDARKDQIGVVEKVGGSVLGLVGLGGLAAAEHSEKNVPESERPTEAVQSIDQGNAKEAETSKDAQTDQAGGVLERVGDTVMSTVGVSGPSTNEDEESKPSKDAQKDQIGVVEKVGGSVLGLVGLGGLAAAEHSEKNVPESERPTEAVQSIDQGNAKEAETSKDAQTDQARGVLERVGDTVMSTVGVSGPSTNEDEESKPSKDAQKDQIGVVEKVGGSVLGLVGLGGLAAAEHSEKNVPESERPTEAVQSIDQGNAKEAETSKDAQTDQAGGVLERVGDTVMSTVGVSGLSTNEDEEFKPSKDAQKDQIGVVEKVGGSVLGLVGLGGLAAAEHSEKNVPESERPTEAVQSIDQGNAKEAETSKDAQTDQAGGVLERVGDTVMSTIGVGGPSADQDEESKTSKDAQGDQVGVVEKVGGSVLGLVGLGGLATAEHSEKNVPENERPTEAVQSIDQGNDEAAETSKDAQTDQAGGVLERVGDTVMSTVGVSGPNANQDEESKTSKDAQKDQIGVVEKVGGSVLGLVGLGGLATAEHSEKNVPESERPTEAVQSIDQSNDKEAETSKDAQTDQAGGVLERVGDSVMSTIGVSGPSTDQDEESKTSKDAQKYQVGVVEKVGGSVLGLVGLGGLATKEHLEKNVPENERPADAAGSIDEGKDEEAKTWKDAQKDQAGVLERVGGTVMSTIGVGEPSTDQDGESKTSKDGKKDQAGVLERVGDTVMSTVGLSGPSTDRDSEGISTAVHDEREEKPSEGQFPKNSMADVREEIKEMQGDQELLGPAAIAEEDSTTKAVSEPRLTVKLGPNKNAGEDTPSSTPRSYEDSWATTPRGTPLIKRVEELEQKLAQLEGRQSPMGEIGSTPPRSSIDRPSRLSTRYVLGKTGSRGTLLDRVAALEQKLAYITSNPSSPSAGHEQLTSSIPASVAEESTQMEMEPTEAQAQDLSTPTEEGGKALEIPVDPKLEETSKAAEDTVGLNTERDASADSPALGKQNETASALGIGAQEKKSKRKAVIGKSKSAIGKSKVAAGKFRGLLLGCFHRGSKDEN